MASVALGFAFLLGAMLVPGGAAAHRTAPAASPVVDYVNISATNGLSFVDSVTHTNAFTVTPGATVHLNVTQLANFNHTFTLSAVANVTIPSSDNATQYFNAHPPLVNLYLGTRAGVTTPYTFTAPTGGTYEFVCLIHFPGMTGVMTSTNHTGGSSHPSSIPLVDIAVGAGVVLILVAVVVVLAYRRR